MPVVQECDLGRALATRPAGPSIGRMGDARPTPAEKYLHDDALVMRRRWSTKWLWLLGLLGFAAVVAWWMTHPEGFSGRGRVEAAVPAGRPVFVGVLGPSSGAGRTIKINDVTPRIDEAPAGTEAVVLICRGGAISTTSDAAAFCTELVEAKGETLHYGDATMEQLVLRVTAPTAGTVKVDGVTLTFRDGLRAGSETVGPHLTLTVLTGSGGTR